MRICSHVDDVDFDALTGGLRFPSSCSVPVASRNVTLALDAPANSRMPAVPIVAAPLPVTAPVMSKWLPLALARVPVFVTAPKMVRSYQYNRYTIVICRRMTCSAQIERTREVG